MKNFAAVLALVLFAAPSLRAEVLTAIPGPDDQGGMIMPMVTLSGNTLGVMFMPPGTPPVLASLNHWSMGDTFQSTAAWYPQLDPVGGAGDLFNNQYGFTFMGSIPAEKALGIRLLSASPGLESWNYVNNQNRFDQIFQNVGDQVLWNGSMWHNYFTLPSNAAPGLYTASFEVFIANTTFTTGTGFADYTANALSATQDMSYSTVTINYTWQVVPEPSTYALAGCALAVLAFAKFRRRTA